MKWGLGVFLVVVLAFPAFVPAGGQPPPAPPSGPWTEAVLGDDGLPSSDQGNHMRLLMRVDLPPAFRGATNIPVSYVLDLETHLAGVYPVDHAGDLRGFNLDLHAFRMVEVDQNSQPVQHDGQTKRVPVMVLAGGNAQPFNASTNPVVTLQWIMDGATTDTRWFYLYFDATHNGHKTAQNNNQALSLAASSTGPGRGTTLYIPPLHRHPGSDPRVIAVTKMQEGDIPVQFTLYDRGLPVGQTTTRSIDGGIGATTRYSYHDLFGGSADGHDALLVRAVDAQGDPSGFITAEVTSRVNTVTSAFTPGSSTLFLPSLDGGYLGARFSETPSVAATWYAFCPPASAQDCKTSDGLGDRNIQPGEFGTFQATANVAKMLTSDRPVAVQRVSDQPTAQMHGLTPWPPLDGPVQASRFAGVALNAQSGLGRDQDDHLSILSMQPGTSLHVKDLSGSRITLADAWQPGLGLFTEQGYGWGTGWDRSWRLESDPGAFPTHESGPVRIRDTTNFGGMAVASGHVADPTQFSAMLPLQSRDGGLHYEAILPPSDQAAIGQVVVFTPHAGTTFTATGHTLDGAPIAGAIVHGGPTQAHQMITLGGGLMSAGWWRIAADKPVLAAWVNEDQAPLAGLALATTQAASVQVVQAEVIGPMFDMTAPDLVKAIPGRVAKFPVDFTLHGRNVTGASINDQVTLDIRVPAGWPSAQIFPGNQIGFAQDGTAQAQISVTVPPGVDPESGGTIRLTARSQLEPRLVLRSQTFLDFETQRGVLVTADNTTVSLQKLVDQGQNATYYVEVINTGTAPDAFDVKISSPDPAWDLQITCLWDEGACPTPQQDVIEGRTPTLGQEESATFILEAGQAGPSSDAARLVTFVVANSTSVTSGVKLVTAVASDRSILTHVVDPTRFVAPGSHTTFNVTVTNAADVAEEVAIEPGGFRPGGWPSPDIDVLQHGASTPRPLDSFPDGRVSIPAGSSIQLIVRQAVPEGSLPFSFGLDRLTIEITDRDIVVPKQDVELRVITAVVRGFEAAAPVQALAIAPGTSAQMALNLRSVANVDQVVEIASEVAGTWGDAWVISDASGNTTPWKVDLGAGQEKTIAVNIEAPRQATPSSAQPTWLTMRLSAAEIDQDEIRIPVEVPNAPGAEVSKDPVVVSRGRIDEIHLGLNNTGNVPLRIRVEWSGIPAWWSPGDEVDLGVGESASVATRFDIPTSAEGGPRDALVRLVAQGAGTVLEAPVVLHVGRPALDAVATDMRILGNGLAVCEVTITNAGEDSAYDIRAVLVDDNELDAVTVHQLHPGNSSVIDLVGPARTAWDVVVTSADDPQGSALVCLLPETQDRRLPFPAFFALPVLAWLARRRMT